jgi:hypothetical protein
MTLLSCSDLYKKSVLKLNCWKIWLRSHPKSQPSYVYEEELLISHQLILDDDVFLFTLFFGIPQVQSIQNSFQIFDFEESLVDSLTMRFNTN